MGVSTSPGLPHALEDAPHPHPRVHGGVYFTWASPCSGGCSTPTPKCGWGICSNAQWAKIDVNQMKKDKPCSSKIFDASTTTVIPATIWCSTIMVDMTSLCSASTVK